MEFLNKEKKDVRWLGIVLSICMFLSYCLADYTKAQGLARAMELLMGMEMNTGMFVMFVIMSSALNYLMFRLFISLTYSLAYRSLVNRTRDIKAMPVSKDSFTNHVQFVLIFVNVVIGALGFAWLYMPVEAGILDLVTTLVFKVIGYTIVLFMLCRVGIGDNVKKKIFGGFLTPIAVLLALMI